MMFKLFGVSPQSAEQTDEESMKSLLYAYESTIQHESSNDRIFKTHAAFAILHAVIAALWITTFWTFKYGPCPVQFTGKGLNRLEFSQYYIRGN